MSRTIKVRAWHKEQKIMGYPYGIIIGRHVYVHNNGIQTWLLDDIELMQYTGLNDKNGREICEGDIVRRGYFALNDFGKFGPEEPWNHLPEGVNEGDITTVLEVWGVASDIAGLQKISEAVCSNPDVVGVEIIGNMYENPDLVKGPGFVR